MPKLKRREYRLRRAGEKGSSVEVTVPPEVLLREANKAGITVSEFIKGFRAVALWDGVDGIIYQFRPYLDEEEVEITLPEQNERGS